MALLPTAKTVKLHKWNDSRSLSNRIGHWDIELDYLEKWVGPSSSPLGGAPAKQDWGACWLIGIGSWSHFRAVETQSSYAVVINCFVLLWIVLLNIVFLLHKEANLSIKLTDLRLLCYILIAADRCAFCFIETCKVQCLWKPGYLTCLCLFLGHSLLCFENTLKP